MFLCFDDADKNEYYYFPVVWAVCNGITTGTSKNTFSPNEFVTRAQFVTFLWRLAGEPRVENVLIFDDVKENEYYSNAVSWAVANNITTGLSQTSFGPDNYCTRSQIVTFLYRYSKAVAE